MESHHNSNAQRGVMRGMNMCAMHHLLLLAITVSSTYDDFNARHKLAHPEMHTNEKAMKRQLELPPLWCPVLQVQTAAASMAQRMQAEPDGARAAVEAFYR